MNDFTIIGGGLSALLTAKELSEAGADVTLVEKSEIGQEASWAGGGILSPLYPWRYPEPVTRLVRWSQRVYPALADELFRTSGVDPEWTQSGMLVVDVPDENACLDWSHRHGVKLDVLNGAELKASEPGLSDKFAHGVRLPDVAQIRNPRLLKALRRTLEIHGVRFMEHCEVRELIVRNQRIVAVETGTERLEAGHVIVACGAWTSDLLGPLSQGANVFPVKGQMLLLAGEPGMVRNIVMKDGCYVIPRRDGKLLVGSTLEFAGFDKATTQEARTLLLESAYELLPQLHDVALARHWAGLRPGSHEGIPAICRHPEVSGLFINAGHFRNGVVMGPAAARLTADLALERSPILDPAPYQMIRPLPGSVRHNKVS